jgi:bacillithiol biosynthesis cysteine-adding enzyme BshC
VSSMETICSYIPYDKTGYFSKLVIDYLNSALLLQPFYNFPATIEGLQQSINQRKNFKNRNLLVETLQQQYEGLHVHEKVSANIQSLSNENTFTVTTAHQPNIFAGPLYVVYKIFHAIKLAEDLQQQLPQYNFVPVYFMGSEDADIEELNNITINQRKYVWETKQTGAVGRMKVDKNLIQLMNEIEGQLSVLPYGNELMKIFRDAYKEKSTIQQSTLHLLNTLFGEYGLIVLIPDNVAFKKMFQPVLEKELKEQFSHKAVKETATQLEQHYKVQASGRAINLFYLIDDKRERIEIENSKFKIQNLDIEFTEDEILRELNEHAERFSPNVILRGALQETILPNIAFIGGGGELAYWLELKAVFSHADVPYPVLFLRNSFLIIDEKQHQVIQKLGLNDEDLFAEEHELMKKIVSINTNNSYNLNGKMESFESLYNKVEQQALSIDPTLSSHVLALKTKALKKLNELEKKLLRAEKRRFVEQRQHIQKLKAILFPTGNLQERVENFSGVYAVDDKKFFEVIKLSSVSFNQKFSIIKKPISS